MSESEFSSGDSRSGDDEDQLSGSFIDDSGSSESGGEKAAEDSGSGQDGPPPERSEGVSVGDEDDGPPEEPDPMRPNGKQNRQEASPPAKRQKQEANPFENPEKAFKEATEPDALTCGICQGDFAYPVIECKACHAPYCESPCMSEWKATRLAANSKENVPCPSCRKTIGYQPCHFKNRELGNQLVACTQAGSGCKKMISRNDMAEHIKRLCKYTKMQCKNRLLGCLWEDFRHLLNQHDEECDMAARAEELAKRQAQLDTANSQLVELENKVEATLGRVNAATEQARLKLYKLEQALHTTQQCMSLGKMQTMLKVRKPDSQVIQLRTRGNKLLPMVVNIHIDERGFFSLHCGFNNDVYRFPLWVTGFLRLNDPIFQGPEACRVFNLQFEDNEKEYPIFDEREAWPTEVDTKQRNKVINISIVGFILHPNDPRD